MLYSIISPLFYIIRDSFESLLPTSGHGCTGDCAAAAVAVSAIDVVVVNIQSSPLEFSTAAATFDGDSTTLPNGNGSLVSKMYGSAFFRWMDFSPFSDGTEGGTCVDVRMSVHA